MTTALICRHPLRIAPDDPQWLTCNADFPHRGDCPGAGTPACLAACGQRAEKPAELLRRAAAHLRALATAAERDVDTSELAAAMHPGIGLALAELLDETAINVDQDAGIAQDSTTVGTITIARRILGEVTR